MVRRGEIYFVDLGPVIGREQAGRRPVLVLSIDPINSKPLVITVIPGTDGANITRDFPTNVRIPAAESGLPMETVFASRCVLSTTLDLPRSRRLSCPPTACAMSKTWFVIAWAFDCPGWPWPAHC